MSESGLTRNALTLWLSTAWQLNAKHSTRRDHTGCRLHIAPLREARIRDQVPVDLDKQAIIAPAVETVAHARDRRKVLRQERPCAPGGGKILDRIPDLAQLHLSRTPNAIATGKQWPHDLPFRIGQIAGTASRPAPMLRLRCARASSAQAIVISIQPHNRTESQPAEITQPISDQTLRHSHKCWPGSRACRERLNGPIPRLLGVMNLWTCR